MINWSKLYDEFLYDCYIANQHLTEEDWLYYGRENHHIDTPARDGGALTPLNSQYLTKQQHWIAGLLQSEVLGKCCFAFVPREKLSPILTLLHDKWKGELIAESNTRRTGDQQNAAMRKMWEHRDKQTQADVMRRVRAATVNYRYKCTVTGHESTASALTRYQRHRGIDPVNRVRVR